MYPTIRELRRQKGLSQTELARNANVSRPYLSAIESGKQLTISNVVMQKLANALDCPVGDIFFTSHVVCEQQREEYA